LQTLPIRSRFEANMGIRLCIGILILVFASLPAGSQSRNPTSAESTPPAPVSNPRFEAAHVDRNKLAPIPPQNGPLHEGDRYVIYALSMQALISYAYNVPENEVLGGPGWLEFDRYDIEAKTPTTTSDADVRLMLKELLGERFHLAARNVTVPLPIRALYLEKDASKLKASDGKGDTGCKGQPPAPGEAPSFTLDCHNMTVENLAQMLQNQAGWQDKRPVVNKTGLKGGFDFKLSWTPDGARGIVGPGGLSFTDAILSELGLKIVSESAPHEALFVDSLDEEPAQDPPGTATIMPPRPLPQFDVSVIKPFEPGSQGRGMMGNGRIDINGITATALIKMAWGLNYPNFIDIVNAPAWLDKDLWYVEAKTSSDQGGANGNNPSQIDRQQELLMIRALLAERFHLQVHMEEREGDAYDLVAANPKLTPVDPNLPPNDPGLRETSFRIPPDGVDPRIKNPALDQLIYLQSEPMQHLADELETIAGGDIHLRVFNKTGLTGRYNITLSFSSMYNMPGNGNGPPPGTTNGSPGAAATSDPSGAVPLSEALRTELGLKLVKVRAPVPVLVIDHVEKPSPN
jgi:uncharacterized protein (TIGR03435 family)